MKRSDWLFVGAATAFLGAIVVAERRRALRPRRADSRDRVVTNLALAGLSAAATQMAMVPIVKPLARRVERNHLGLVQRMSLSVAMRDAVAVLLLDYTLYLWHVVEHKVGWLYRFHQVHHADLSLDASTAARFHFGELLASVPWRSAQIVAIGVSPRALATWNTLTMLSVAFHHSNIRLPIALERVLSRLVMTPRLHGIHHSIVEDEQNSNWSSGLTWWDRLHRTYRGNVAQCEITLGVPAYRRPRAVGLRASLEMPLHPLPPWQLPNGAKPARRPRIIPKTHLLA